MPDQIRHTAGAVYLIVALVLAGCSTGTAGLTTGSLFGSKRSPVAPEPETALDRTLQVATTSARASRCGYVFDPVSIRTGYLAHESGLGNTPDQMAKIEKSYDYTVSTIGKTIAGEENYCNESTTNVIKNDLSKIIAGNYSAPAKKLDVGVFSEETEKLDREKLFNPIR